VPKKKRKDADKAPVTFSSDDPESDVFPIPHQRPSMRPTAPPPRAEMPTFPTDLSEYARERTGPDHGDVSSTGALEFEPSRVPTLAVSREELVRLQLDHRSGFLLSLLDGVATAEMIVDVSGMPEEEALMALYDLYVRGVITFR
jgi:hypothetical protein